MRKIITFLGVNLHRDQETKALIATTYRHNDRDYRGFVFAQALYQFCDFDEMLVCMTGKAREDAWKVLLASGEAPELADDRVRDISIKTGRNTDEMWEIFETIVQNVNEGDDIIFDITHSLRSLPFLVFLFAAYLKKAKNVSIQAIYYGAFDLAQDNGGIAPVIDLSSFVGMLDWLTATDRFTATGDGEALARLIGSGSDIGKAINGISLALALTRPLEVREKSVALNDAMTNAASSLDQVKPFALLKGQVQSAYGQFAIDDQNDTKAIMAKQFDMIQWYLDRQQIDQAFMLSIEWIISICGHSLNKIREADRSKIRQALNSLSYMDLQAIIDHKVGNSHSGDHPDVKKRIKGIKTDYKKYDEPLRKTAGIDRVQDIWKRTNKIRNQIAHCGMSGSESANSIQLAAANLEKDLKEIVDLML